MNLLLDTHVYLWARLDDPSLPPEFREAIADPGSTVFVSAITMSEISVKRSTGKLDAPPQILGPIEPLGFDELAFTHRHARALGTLPLLHRDPFDRMLIAQAVAEDLLFLTVDRSCIRYDVPLLPRRT